MDPHQLTQEYFARWLGVSAATFNQPGLTFQHDSELSQPHAGYGKPYDIYACAAGPTVVVGYGDGAADGIDQLAALVSPSPDADSLNSALAEVYGSQPSRMVFFEHSQAIRGLGDIAGPSLHAGGRRTPGAGGSVSVPGPVPPLEASAKPVIRRLEAQDYSLFRDFFLTANPDQTDTSWLEGYYQDIVGKGLAYAALVSVPAGGRDGNNRSEGYRIASMADSPSMPFLADRIQEIGIETLPTHQRQGLARQVCAAVIHAMSERGLVPLWGADSANVASQALAQSLGFTYFCDNLTIRLE